MKKLAIALMAMCCGWQLATAQIDVLSITPLPETQGKGFYHPTFSPTGDYLLLTGANFKGLTKYDLSSGQMARLTDVENAGYYPQISDGGKVVVFREVGYKKNRRFTSIKSINLENGKVSRIDKASRQLYPFTFVGGTLRIAKGKSIKSKRLATDMRTPVEESLIVAIEDRSLELYRGNKRIVLNPNGDGSRPYRCKDIYQSRSRRLERRERPEYRDPYPCSGRYAGLLGIVVEPLEGALSARLARGG